MTQYDEVNMVSAVLAKKMGAKETIVRVRNPEYSNPYFKEKKRDDIEGEALLLPYHVKASDN